MSRELGFNVELPFTRCRHAGTLDRLDRVTQFAGFEMTAHTQLVA